MERWNLGILGIKTKKHYSCPRSTPFEDRFAKARGKELLAFSLKSAGSGRSSNLYQGNAARSEFFRDLVTLHEHEIHGHEV
jgi:hypothetical protein